jgi:hypothetical protein
MSTQAAPDRWQEIRGIHREYRFFYQIGGGLLLVVIGVLIGGTLFSTDPDGYKANLYTDALSVLVTVLVLDRLAERRRILDIQERLIMVAGGQSNETAKRAIDELRHRGWLEGADGLLRKVRLWNAKLQGADLRNANLSGTDMQEASLERAILRGAKLERAMLPFTKLEGADLREANLQGAVLFKADLKVANLWRANCQAAYLDRANLRQAILAETNFQDSNLAETDFRMANLRGSNFRGAILEKARFDEETVLPDAQFVRREKDGTEIFDKYWTPDTDLSRFTNPNHPNFWHWQGPFSSTYDEQSEADAEDEEQEG